MSSSKRQYPWEVEQPSGVPAWDEPGLQKFQEAYASEEDSLDETSDPAQELLDFLMEQHNSGALSAKQVCIICYWAGEAGINAAKPLGLPPWTKGSGDFKRLLDKRVPAKGPHTYQFAAPTYSRREGQRGVQNLAVLLPHELLEQDLQREDMASLKSQWQEPPNFGQHRVVQEAAAQADDRPVVPISLFLDGVAYAKRDSLLCVTIQNLWTGHRFVICALRKRILCKCGCKGWDTLHAMFLWLRWTLKALATGVRPEHRHDGNAWDQDLDERRAAAAGSRLSFVGAVTQLRADWGEIAHTMAVPQWSSHSQPCFLCRASHDNVSAKLLECDFQQLAWELKTAESYSAACGACEIWVDPLSREDWVQLKKVLETDARSDGARGLALQKPYPKLNLKRGDRLEPTAELWDTQLFFADEPPKRALFWRRAAETAALRRNPLFCEELGMDTGSVVAIDAMHTLCLGIHQQLVLQGLWTLVDGWTLAGNPGRSTRPGCRKAGSVTQVWS